MVLHNPVKKVHFSRTTQFEIFFCEVNMISEMDFFPCFGSLISYLILLWMYVQTIIWCFDKLVYRNDENYSINADFSEPKNPPKNGEWLSDYIITNKGLNWTSNDTSVSETELFEKATYEVDELVKRFYVRFFKANPVSQYFSILFVGI